MSFIGRCQCQRNAYEVDGELPEELTRCTCSICSKLGALYAYYKPEQLDLLTPRSDLDVYRWKTGLTAFHFCGNCGCFIFTDSPAYEPGGKWDGKTRRIGINARLVDDFDAASAPVKVIDGKNLW